MVVCGWYWHAHQLGQSSGLSFGFWGSDSDRSSLDLLLSAESWFNLALRIVIRLLAVVGLPFLVLGIRHSWTSGGGRIALSGLIGLALCTVATMRSSTVHDYYQLPMLLVTCPLVGLGWQKWHQQNHRPRWQPMAVLALWMAISITVLSLDYWAVEQRQARDWLPLALNIRKTLPQDARIVSVTSTDPTLLNLARRQGWLISAKNLNAKRFAKWDAAGATHLAGSFQWEKMYRPMPEQRRLALQELAASTPGSWVDPISNTYLIPLKDLPARALNQARCKNRIGKNGLNDLILALPHDARSPRQAHNGPADRFDGVSSPIWANQLQILRSSWNSAACCREKGSEQSNPRSEHPRIDRDRKKFERVITSHWRWQKSASVSSHESGTNTS